MLIADTRESSVKLIRIKRGEMMAKGNGCLAHCSYNYNILQMLTKKSRIVSQYNLFLLSSQ